ncbi:MAG: SUMF1/EgtB/PvdO family nonheme iron enzyme [Nitrospirae bacterium]|nr:SUMF1/EgtB/PvdO family nonheme iron enzyme [Nitrospirota bacterium]MBF0536387.1 SUMF1/EgtB/PvdO family nonheme iron enzyme [Nitrospirota bacterium]MBF0618175.1 SUMF1/EgtB/PvdO family nonheme iron enzyme [Nitrospirota bacterium]
MPVVMLMFMIKLLKEYLISIGHYLIVMNGYAVTSPVGSFKANNYGLYDMLGNVWQWTSSVSGGYRVDRGGSGAAAPRMCDVPTGTTTPPTTETTT